MRLVLLFLFSLIIGCTANPKDISLLTSEGEKFTLEEIKNNKATVFIFLATECPLSQSYTNTITRLNEKYREEKIKFFAVFPGGKVEVNDIETFRNNYNFNLKSLLDEKKELTELLKATITPEAFVLDSKLQTLYSGRIDDWAPALGTKKQVVTSHDLDNALSAIVTGKDIPVKHTKAVGCFIE